MDIHMAWQCVKEPSYTGHKGNGCCQASAEDKAEFTASHLSPEGPGDPSAPATA